MILDKLIVMDDVSGLVGISFSIGDGEKFDLYVNKNYKYLF